GVVCWQRGHSVDGHGRGVLGQRRGGEFLLASQDRVLPPRDLRDAAGGEDCGDGIHRGLVQPSASECAGRIPCPGDGVDAVSGKWPCQRGRIKLNTQLSQKLDERKNWQGTETDPPQIRIRRPALNPPTRVWLR